MTLVLALSLGATAAAQSPSVLPEPSIGVANPPAACAPVASIAPGASVAPGSSVAPDGSAAASVDACPLGIDSLTWQKAKLPKAVTSAPTVLGSIAFDGGGNMSLLVRPRDAGSPALNAWHSTDGLTWKLVDPTGGEDPILVWNYAGVAVAGDRFVAIGGSRGFTALSTSGLKWKATKAGIKGAKTVGPVTSTSTGAAVAGEDAAGTAVWTTTDGKKWSRVQLPAGAGPFTTIAASPTGLLAAATWGPTDYWLAPDGVTWQSAPLPVDANGRVVSLTGTADGVLLLAAQLQDDGVPVGSTIWTSPDGLAWQKVRSVDSPAYTASFGPLGIVVASQTTMLQSTDGGATWTEAPLPAELEGSVVTLLAQTPDGRLLVGTLVAAEREVAIWVGTPTQ